MIVNGKKIRTSLKLMTSTLKYIEIEVLELGLSGTRPDFYRYDLESFFYVLLSICVSYS